MLIISLLALNLAFCSSAEKKESTEETEEVTEEEAEEETVELKERAFDLNILEEINITLKEYRYPDGVRRRGFGYKKADVLSEDFNKWASDNISFIKEAFDKLPEGYKLQIKGHADSVGPEEEEGGKKGNVYYSQIRAEAVKQALVEQGLPGDRITTVAAGSTEPVSGYDEDDEINRRVTFQVIKSEEETSEEDSME